MNDLQYIKKTFFKARKGFGNLKGISIFVTEIPVFNLKDLNHVSLREVKKTILQNPDGKDILKQNGMPIVKRKGKESFLYTGSISTTNMIYRSCGHRGTILPEVKTIKLVIKNI